MFYFWVLDLCATCAREEQDFGPYHSVEELLSGIGETHRKLSLYALGLLAEGYGMTAIP
jgi:hypothetical protein